MHTTQAEIAAAHAANLYATLSTEDADAQEPWFPGLIPGVLVKDTRDDDGEDFTATFLDGSVARWINSTRTWNVVE